MSTQPDPARVALALRLLVVSERGAAVYRDGSGVWWMDRYGDFESGPHCSRLAAIAAAEDALGIKDEEESQ